MNQLATLIPKDLPDDEEVTDFTDELGKPKWELKQLKPKHKQVASLVAQGFKNTEIANMVGITPEYVSMLLGQPLVRGYVNEINQVVGTRLEAMFEQSVEVISETMRSGSNGDKLKAARLQLEATKRIGRPDPNATSLDPNVDRLALLAERLIALQTGVRQGGTFDESGKEITDA